MESFGFLFFRKDPEGSKFFDSWAAFGQNKGTMRDLLKTLQIEPWRKGKKPWELMKIDAFIEKSKFYKIRHSRESGNPFESRDSGLPPPRERRPLRLLTRSTRFIEEK